MLHNVSGMIHDIDMPICRWQSVPSFCEYATAERPLERPARAPRYLDGLAGAQAAAGVAHVDGPVEADDVGAGGAHALQQAAAAVGVQRDGHRRVALLHGADDVLDVRP